MLKASLDYESGCVGAAPVPPKPSKLRRKKKSSAGSADKSDEVSGRTSSMSHATSTHAMSVKPQGHDQIVARHGRREKLNVPGGGARREPKAASRKPDWG